MNAYDWLLF